MYTETGSLKLVCNKMGEFTQMNVHAYPRPEYARNDLLPAITSLRQDCMPASSIIRFPSKRLCITWQRLTAIR